jgi:hypothetical protein
MRDGDEPTVSRLGSQRPGKLGQRIHSSRIVSRQKRDYRTAFDSRRVSRTTLVNYVRSRNRRRLREPDAPAQASTRLPFEDLLASDDVSRLQSYSIPEAIKAAVLPSDDENERRVAFSEIAPTAKDAFSLAYDFGAGWRHRVTVRRSRRERRASRIPLRRRSSGLSAGRLWRTYGYRQLLAAHADVHHPDHDEVIRWSTTNSIPTRPVWKTPTLG